MSDVTDVGFINQPTAPEEETPWKLPSTRKVGMISLIVTESALFSIFVVAFVYYLGKSQNGPYPSELMVERPWLASAALIGSSFTIMIAEWFLRRNRMVGFQIWWLITILGGAYFLGFTALEWHHLIYNEGLTISRNIFGACFFSLVGLHASHVIIGLILLTIIMISSARGKLDHEHHEHVEVISWYWHFVDWVWVIVFTLVYLVSPHYGTQLPH
jgi:cytochrome c oxidase subunit 3/cytochrome o ubiquinol oxidase subunit 3